MTTDSDTVKHLSRQCLSYLVKEKLVSFEADDRRAISEGLNNVLKNYVISEAEIRDQARELLKENQEDLGDQGMEGSRFYEAAKKKIVESFQGESLNGLYLKKSPKDIVSEIQNYLLNEPLIEDVYGSDEELEEKTLKALTEFDPKNTA
jgi:hypothetical protein